MMALVITSILMGRMDLAGDADANRAVEVNYNVLQSDSPA